MPKLVYVAASSGRIAAENALTNANKELDLSSLPAVIFTDPQVASAGLSEKAAKRGGYDLRVSVFPLKRVPRA